MNRRPFLLSGFFATLVLGLASPGAGAAGADLTAPCAKCHGADGIASKADHPTIAGMPEEIQQDALVAYRDGGRKCVKVPDMCKAVAKLTDAEIATVAKTYAAMPFKPVQQPSDAALAAKGKVLHDKNCKRCHGTGPADGDSGILHGQRIDYLRYALGQYMSGAREQDAMMKSKTSKLTPADVDALVNYYASYK